MVYQSHYTQIKWYEISDAIKDRSHQNEYLFDEVKVCVTVFAAGAQNLQ